MNKSLLFVAFIAFVAMIVATQAFNVENYVHNPSVLSSDKLYMYSSGKKFSYKPSKGPALFQYVEKKDSNYEWSVAAEPEQRANYSLHRLSMTSLRWLNEVEIPQGSLWQHDIAIIRPNELVSEKHHAFWIVGCALNDTACEEEDIEQAAQMAVLAKVSFVVCFQLPNQPVVFASDASAEQRTEDELVGYTWAQILQNTTVTADYNAYFPMVKAAVGAINAAKEYSKDLVRQGLATHSFQHAYIYGLSKRGGSSWLVASYLQSLAHDRVFGVAPIVFDVSPNFQKTASSATEALGAFPWAFEYYVAITDAANTKADLAPLADQLDPLGDNYRQYIQAVPKLVCSATADQFFLPTNDHSYWGDLQNAHRLIAPNTDHSYTAGLPLLTPALAAHVNRLATQRPLPQVENLRDDATRSVALKTDIQPTKVQVWRADTLPGSPARLDFRAQKLNVPGNCESPAYAITSSLCQQPIVWEALEVEGELVNGQYVYNYTIPEDDVPEGVFSGAYLEAIYNLDDQEAHFTTSIVFSAPFPFQNCDVDGDCADVGLI